MMPDAEFDEHGYPSDASIEAIEQFSGTPAEFVEFVTVLYRNGFVKVEQLVDEWNRGFRRITFVTGGWSGCESVMGAITSATMFNSAFWRRSERGGLDVFEISDVLWSADGDWGRAFPKPVIEWAAQIVSEDGTMTTTIAASEGEAVKSVMGSSSPNKVLVWREVSPWHERHIDALLPNLSQPHIDEL